MFALTFQTSVIAIIQIFLLGTAGYVLVKRAVIGDEGLKLLSHLMVNIFFPLFIFYQLTHHFDFKAIPFWWVFPLISLGVILTGAGVSALLLAVFPIKLRNEFRAVTGMHNAGYLPLLLATTLPLGEQAGTLYIYILLFILGFDFCLWSLGVWLLRRDDIPAMDLRKLINPPLLTMAGTLLLISLGLHKFIPEAVMKPVKILGDCALPIAMIVTGGNLAMTKMSNIRKLDIAVVCAGKLLIMPMLGFLFVLLFKPDPLIALLIDRKSVV